MGSHRRQVITLAILLLAGTALWARNKSKHDSNKFEEGQPVSNDTAARIFWRENKTIADLKGYTPIVETYIQNFG